MTLLAISEHYYPRVGGTVNYVHETLCALATLGVSAELVVPGPAPADWRPDGMEIPPYTVTWLDTGYPATGDPTRDQRYAFCHAVDRLAKARLNGPGRPDVLHVLFGLFVMEVLDTAALRNAGLPSLATVHNVPPMECRQIAHDAALPARMKETLRLAAVTWKNRSRLKKHRYDRYIVPSEQVQRLLTSVVGPQVSVIGHGLTSDLQALMSPPDTRRPSGPVHLLTAGGYVPHKRQHLVPETSARLRDSGVAFRWDVVGPPGRVPGYYDAIQAEVTARGLDGQVQLHKAVPFAALAALYDRAHLYVQPSIEEGFCLTALDAAAAGLPVIGCRAGALPDIIEASEGRLVASAPGPLAEAIVAFLRSSAWPEAGAMAARVRAQFSWEKAAEGLRDTYAALAGQGDG